MGKFVIKKTNTGYNFNLKANNGETIATSEVYTTLDAARNGVASVAKNAPIANLEDQTLADFEVAKHPKFEIYKDKSEQFRFRLKAKNGQVISASEGYKSKKSCENGIASVRKNAAEADITVAEKKEKK